MAKKETAEETLARISKLYGEGAVFRGSESLPNVEVVPHKSIGMNLASGIGGIPRGKLIQIEGNQHVGKTTLVGEIIAQFQAAGDNCALFDFEYAFDKKYGATLGIDMDKLVFSQPSTMEEGYEIILDLVASGNFRLIVIDSLNMMVPKDKFQADMEDKHVASEARLHDLAIKKLKVLLASTGTTLIGISQYRDNIGAMGAGNDKKLAGGNSWWFGCDFRIKLSRFSTKKEDGYYINNIEITKNKSGTPFGKEKWYLSLSNGTDTVREILEYGKEYKVIDMKGGGHYSYGDVKLGQGIDNVRSFFNDNPEYLEEIQKELHKTIFG